MASLKSVELNKISFLKRSTTAFFLPGSILNFLLLKDASPCLNEVSMNSSNPFSNTSFFTPNFNKLLLILTNSSFIYLAFFTTSLPNTLGSNNFNISLVTSLSSYLNILFPAASIVDVTLPGVLNYCCNTL